MSFYVEYILYFFCKFNCFGINHILYEEYIHFSSLYVEYILHLFCKYNCSGINDILNEEYMRSDVYFVKFIVFEKYKSFS